VPFKLYDRSSEMYTSPKVPFSGEGSTLVADHNVAYTAARDSKQQNVHSLSTIGNDGPNRGGKTKEEFLKNLPTSVIKNGRVIDVRNSIATDLFKGSSRADPSTELQEKPAGGGGGSATGNVIIANTDVVSYLRGVRPDPTNNNNNSTTNKTNNNSSSSSSNNNTTSPNKNNANISNNNNTTDNKNSTNNKLNTNNSSPTKQQQQQGGAIFSSEDRTTITTTPRTITTLKVKTNSGDTIIVKLKFDDTIATLRKYIDQYNKDHSVYELRTTFPNTVYSDTTVTLRAAGLVPNATLYVKPI